MVAIKCFIIRFIDDHQPGFVECKLYDARNKEHVFHEKIPIVSREDIAKDTIYPVDGVLGCEIVKKWTDENGQKILTATTTVPWGIESIDGLTEFDVLREQIVELI